VKFKALRPVEFEADRIEVRVPIRDDEVDEVRATSFGVFLLDDHRLDSATLESAKGSALRFVLLLDERRIEGWPGGEAELSTKVRDEGFYTLQHGDKRIRMLADYVPACIPNEFGDYLTLSVTSDGTVINWDPSPKQVSESFFPSPDGS
jgi:hypothetical protein